MQRTSGTRGELHPRSRHSTFTLMKETVRSDDLSGASSSWPPSPLSSAGGDAGTLPTSLCAERSRPACPMSSPPCSSAVSRLPPLLLIIPCCMARVWERHIHPPEPISKLLAVRKLAVQQGCNIQSILVWSCVNQQQCFHDAKTRSHKFASFSSETPLTIPAPMVIRAVEMIEQGQTSQRPAGSFCPP